MITFSSIIDSITQILCQLIGVLFILATVVFLWGVVQYVIARGAEEKIKESRQYIIYGLFGLFIMVAMWGIVNAAVLTFFGSGGGGFNQCQFFGGGSGGGGLGGNNNGNSSYTCGCLNNSTCEVSQTWSSSDGFCNSIQACLNCSLSYPGTRCVLLDEAICGNG